MSIWRILSGLKPMTFFLILIFLWLPLLSACSSPVADAPPTLTSPNFADGEAIPREYTCDGNDISPQLRWENLPEGTETVALIMDDPDAPGGTWVHWVVYDIPAAAAGLPENAPAADSLPDGGTQGNNSWERLGYGGPCPPGGEHRYFFKLYALDTTLSLPPGGSKEDLLAVMEDHVLGQGQLMGSYARD